MAGFLLISFLAGALTVLAPCILPLLPVIVGGSLSEKQNVRRVFTIVASLGASVFLFTLILKVSTAFVSIPAIFWQLFSGVLLVFFGLVTMVPTLWDYLPGVSALYRKSNRMLGSGYQKQNLWGDVVMGAALGPVFSSCSPTYFVILAAVLPAHFTTGVVYLVAYTLGLCLSLFVIALLGQRAALWLGVTSDPRGWFKKSIGVLFLLVGIAIIFGLDKRLEAALPAGAFWEISLEQQLLSSQNNPAGNSVSNPQNNPQSSSEANPASGGVAATTTAPTSPATHQESAATNFLTAAEKMLRYQKAPELVTPDGYINTGGQAITLKQYVGKNVVLVDFWDYTCINCQRTLPYVTAWYQKYKDQGLVVVGVHTPEFAFEHQQSNVEDATKRFGITYPVVLDNEYQT